MENKIEKTVRCPVCGQYEFSRKDDYDICEICGWENDGLQYDDPDYEGGANEMSLNQAKRAWAAGRPVE